MAGAARSASTSDLERVLECPTCGAANPEPDAAVICHSCGTIMPVRLRKMLKVALAVLGAAGAALLTGILTALAGAGGWLFLLAVSGLAVAGALLLIGAGLVVWRVIHAVSARESSEAQKFLAKADKVSTIVLGSLVAVGVLFSSYYALSVAPANARKRSEAVAAKQRAEIQAAFGDKLAPFVALAPNPLAGTDPALQATAPIKPKVLVVERHLPDEEENTVDIVEEGRVSQVQFALPEELRAAAPGEVKTLVWLEWKAVLKGRYGGEGGKVRAFRWECQATLFDVDSKAAIARSDVFEGTNPPGKTASQQDVYGPRPIEAIAAWVAGLPLATGQATPEQPPPTTPESSPPVTPEGSPPPADPSTPPAAETPPAETPPAETPPAETPPAETPPAETPPAETPPATEPSPPPSP